MDSLNLFERATTLVFGFICHQDPDILIYVNGKAVELCPRCIGLQLGFVMSFMLLSIVRCHLRVLSVGKSAIWFPAVCAAIAPVHWAFCRVGIMPATSLTRLVTGLATGSALGILLIAYNSGNVGQSEGGCFQLRPYLVIGYLSAISIFGVAIVLASSWTTVTLIAFVSVLTNATIAIRVLQTILCKVLKIP